MPLDAVSLFLSNLCDYLHNTMGSQHRWHAIAELSKGLKREHVLHMLQVDRGVYQRAMDAVKHDRQPPAYPNFPSNVTRERIPKEVTEFVVSFWWVLLCACLSSMCLLYFLLS